MQAKRIVLVSTMFVLVAVTCVPRVEFYSGTRKEKARYYSFIFDMRSHTRIDSQQLTVNALFAALVGVLVAMAPSFRRRTTRVRAAQATEQSDEAAGPPAAPTGRNAARGPVPNRTEEWKALVRRLLDENIDDILNGKLTATDIHEMANRKERTTSNKNG